MLASLELDPRAVPASNVIFVRSSTEATLETNKEALLQVCWPVHRAVIDALGIRVVICFGATAGRWVRERIGPGSRSTAFRRRTAVDGGATLTSPAMAKWCSR